MKSTAAPVWSEPAVRRAWLSAKTLAEQCEMLDRPDLSLMARQVRNALGADLARHGSEYVQAPPCVHDPDYNYHCLKCDAFLDVPGR
jgi:hypothetical protein